MGCRKFYSTRPGFFGVFTAETLLNFTLNSSNLNYISSISKVNIFQYSSQERFERSASNIFHKQQAQYDGLKQHTLIRLLILKSHSGSCKPAT